MAPEQARGRWDSVDGRADLWALGATMFALLTCRYVHEEETPNEQFLAAMTKPAPPIRELEPELHARVAEIVDRALAFDREQRFASAADMKAAVDEALAELEPTAEAQAVAVPAAPIDPTKAPITGGASVADVATPPLPAKKRPPFTLIAVGFAGVAIAAFAIRSQPRTTDVALNASANMALESAPTHAATQAAPVTSSAPAPQPAATAEVDAGALGKAVEPKTKPMPKSVAAPHRESAREPTPPAAAPTPAPATSVDIFGRRR